MVPILGRHALSWFWALLPLLVCVLSACEPLYQSYTFTAPLATRMPVEVAADDVWVTSVPVGADVYVQPYDPEQLPSHATDSLAYQGKTPLRFALPPGAYFSPPYEDVQFEPDGAASEALLFRPFSTGEKRRVLRYYRLDKQPQQGQTLIALFYPRGAPLERVLGLYPPEKQYRFIDDELLDILQQAQVPQDVQETFLTLMQQGGKAFWSMGEAYQVALELQPRVIRGRVLALYTGPPVPDPLLPDGGGF
jgi:hypothetical protein